LNNRSQFDHSQSKEKTLKYSKSVENFQMLPTHSQPPRKQLIKNDEDDIWANKTEIQERNHLKLEAVVEHLREEVETYKRKIAHL
jgi:hypothetical protein